MQNREAFINRKYVFLTITGHCIARNVQLLADGTISGIDHPNERYWDVSWEGLQFFNEDRQITSNFIHILEIGSQMLLLGIFLPGNPSEIWHVLWQSNMPAVESPSPFDRQLHDLQQTLNFVARRLPQAPKRSIKALFLVHNIEAWDSLMDIYEAMRAAPDFEPIVATLPRCYHGDSIIFDGETANHEGLQRLGVPHIRPATGSEEMMLDIIKALSPDLIFRQSPWDSDVPSSLNAAALSFARLCYVPYFGSAIVDQFNAGGDSVDLHSDQPFHRFCWRIYVENDAAAEKIRDHSARGGDNVVLTGHPKLDRLWGARQHPVWPIVGTDGPKRFRLIWAPHHSITTDWLGFGTFLQTHQAMLDWAKTDPEIEIVLKPHPALFARLRAAPDLPTTFLESFLGAWHRMPNTALVEGGDYGPLFSGSDAMITDGISFLTEYQLFDKPLLFLDSGHHVPFNQFGTEIMTGVQGVSNVEEASTFLRNFRMTGHDPKLEARRKVAQLLRPFAGQAVSLVLDDLRRSLALENGGTTESVENRRPWSLWKRFFARS